MTTKTISKNSSTGIYYGPVAANYTIVNNFTIVNPSSNAGSRYGDNAADLYEANNLTLVNSGTFDSTYSGVNGNTGAGVAFYGTLAMHASITNTASGVIEDTGGRGYGVLIHGGVIVNYGRISGGPGTPGYNNYSAGVLMGSNGGFSKYPPAKPGALEFWPLKAA